MAESTRIGRPARLDRTLIVAAAVALADENGLDRLTMRTLAEALAATPAALYRHVEGRDELVDLVLDEALAGRTETQPTKEWRADLAAFVRGLFAVHRTHPWLAAGPYPTTVGPQTIATMGEAIALLEPHPADIGRKRTAIAVLFQLVSGHARGVEAARRLAGQLTDDAEQLTGVAGEVDGGTSTEAAISDDYMIAVIIAAVGGILDAADL